MKDKLTFSVDLGLPHTSNDPSRGYIEYDPIVRLSNGNKIHGEHGLIDLKAEIANSAFDAGMLGNPVIRDILKP
ncbi:hypothetical protein JYT44_02555 [Caldithrix abyssi]|nr:hypothetical protein [Caldithrix abyssi]